MAKAVVSEANTRSQTAVLEAAIAVSEVAVGVGEGMAMAETASGELEEAAAVGSASGAVDLAAADSAEAAVAVGLAPAA